MRSIGTGSQMARDLWKTWKLRCRSMLIEESKTFLRISRRMTYPWIVRLRLLVRIRIRIRRVNHYLGMEHIRRLWLSQGSGSSHLKNRATVCNLLASNLDQMTRVDGLNLSRTMTWKTVKMSYLTEEEMSKVYAG